MGSNKYNNVTAGDDSGASEGGELIIALWHVAEPCHGRHDFLDARREQSVHQTRGVGVANTQRVTEVADWSAAEHELDNQLKITRALFAKLQKVWVGSTNRERVLLERLKQLVSDLERASYRRTLVGWSRIKFQ